MKMVLKKFVALTFAVMLAVVAGCTPAEEGGAEEAPPAETEESAE